MHRLKRLFLFFGTIFFFYPFPLRGGEPIPTLSSLSKADVGKEVLLWGRISNIPWQHIVASQYGRFSEYIDLEEGPQIVAYSTTKIVCLDWLKLQGKVVAVESDPKRPGKAGDKYVEYHLAVSKWNCQKTKGGKP